MLRDGETLSIPAAQLVPGDIVHIRAGNKIPADLRLCETSADLKFNRSILTGEADAIKASVNSTSDNFLEVTPAINDANDRPRTSRCKAHTAFPVPGLVSSFSLVTTRYLAKSQNSPRKESRGSPLYKRRFSVSSSSSSPP